MKKADQQTKDEGKEKEGSENCSQGDKKRQNVKEEEKQNRKRVKKRRETRAISQKRKLREEIHTE